MDERNLRTRRTAFAAIIAALYVVLTAIASAVGLSSGAIQFRISEALCILPAFTPAAVPGLAIGCLLSNLLAGGIALDVAFGTLATLLGAIGTYLLRKNRWLAGVCPIAANMLIVPWVLRVGYGIPTPYWRLALTVGIGEFVCAGIGGQLLYSLIRRRKLDQFIK